MNLALSKAYKKGIVKASSLLESVIAITVLSLCTLIAVQIYAGLLADSPSLLYYKAKFQMQEIITQTQKNHDFEEEVFDFKNYTIIKNSTDYGDHLTLKKITLKAIVAKDTLREDFLIKIPSNL